MTGRLADADAGHGYQAQVLTSTPAPHFNPHVPTGHACRTCRHSIGTADGWHLWCERHRIVSVCPCGLWEREPGADDAPAAQVEARSK